MRTIFALAALPLFCLLGFAIIFVVIVYLVVRKFRSNTNLNSSINPEVNNSEMGNNDRDSRWAHADTAPSKTQVSTKLEPKACPACGGENPTGASKCEYCGAKLS